MLADDFSDNSSSLALYNDANTSEKCVGGGKITSSNMAIIAHGGLQPRSSLIEINIDALLDELSDIKPAEK